MPTEHDTTKPKEWTIWLLFWLLGISSWIDVSGLFNELSLMVNDLSEGYEIWSYITLIIQLANIGPLIYSFIPRRYKTNKFVIGSGYFIFTVSFLSMMIMCLFWDTQTMIFGEKRSLVLFVTTFGTSLCDCMTSIIFWVFVSWFPTQYMTALSAGESSSGIISAILIWIQQLNRPAHDPRYSVNIYLFCIGLFIPISGIAFTVLLLFLNKGYFIDATDWISSNGIKKTTDKLPNDDNDKNKEETVESPLSKMDAMRNKGFIKYETVELIENNNNNDNNDNKTNDYGSNDIISTKNEALLLNNVTSGYWHWIIMIAVLSGIQNGMLPAISSFALLPYGNTVYILSTTLNNSFAPLISLLPAILSRYILNTKFIFISCIGWLCAAIYILIIALQSPNQFGLSHNDHKISKQFWSVIMIIVYVSCGQFLTICKTCIYLLIKKSYPMKAKGLNEESLEKGLSKLMEIVGYGVQIGSFCGAVIFFLLVNVAHIFEQQY